MLPKSLGGWTLDVVRDLVFKGLFESDVFDLKEMLPHSKNDEDKERLRKSCAAFANSAGGFLVYGVKDSATAGEDRVIGVDPSIDFPERFGNYPGLCEPLVAWDLLNPPLTLPSGRFVHVVSIPQSWRAPHAVRGDGGSLIFPKRTNKGNELMPYSEVQRTFLGFYEKRMKLHLLTAELEQLKAEASGMIIEESANDGKSYTLISLSLTVLETVLADTYTILYESPSIVPTLGAIRSKVRIINPRVSLLLSKVALPMTGREEFIKDHNRWIRDQCVRLIHMIDEVLPAIAPLAI